MHILMYRWKAYNYRDIEQTFLLLGHTVDNIEQELGSYDVSPEFERVIEEKIRGTHYDMVFTVNYFPLISNVCERTGVKYVSWTCDNPLISMYHESVFHACNYIFTFDKTNYLEFRGDGRKTYLVSPAGGRYRSGWMRCSGRRKNRKDGMPHRIRRCGNTAEMWRLWEAFMNAIPMTRSKTGCRSI